MNYLKCGLMLTVFSTMMALSGCVAPQVTQKQFISTNLNHQKGKVMQITDSQQETIIRLIQEAINLVKNKSTIDNNTKLIGEFHKDKDILLEEKERRTYQYVYSNILEGQEYSNIKVYLYTHKNSQGQYIISKADVDVSNGAYKTNFPYDIFIERLGLKRYREYNDKGVRPSISFPNAMYTHWMHGDLYFVYPYQTKTKPEIAVVTSIIESGLGNGLKEQTVRGDINMDYPLNVESIEIYAK